MYENPYSSPASHSWGGERSGRTRIIRRINPLQLGKVLAICYAMISLLVVPIFLLGAAFGNNKAPGGSMVFVLLLPVLYGIAGFIGGLLCGFFYNICAKITGGIEVEIE